MTKQARNGETLLVPLLLPEDPLVDKSTSMRHADKLYKDYPKERHKTVLAFFVMLIFAFFNGVVAAYITDFVPRTPLRDVVFEFISEQRWAWKLSDMIACGLGLTNIIFAILHKHRWIVSRRIFFIHAQLYLLRAICMGVTWLSVPGQQQLQRCVEIADEKEFVTVFYRRISRFLLTFGVVSVEKGNKLLCGDYIFSGHTLVMVVTWYTLAYYLPLKNCRLIRLVVGCFAVIGMILIVLCRMHYTVDVVLALIITASYFVIYHVIVESAANNDHNWLHQSKCIFWLLYWFPFFESKVPPCRVPRKLEWPLSKPSFCRKLIKKLND